MCDRIVLPRDGCSPQYKLPVVASIRERLFVLSEQNGEGERKRWDEGKWNELNWPHQSEKHTKTIVDTMQPPKAEPPLSCQDRTRRWSVRGKARAAKSNQIDAGRGQDRSWRIGRRRSSQEIRYAALGLRGTLFWAIVKEKFPDKESIR